MAILAIKRGKRSHVSIGGKMISTSKFHKCNAHVTEYKFDKIPYYKAVSYTHLDVYKRQRTQSDSAIAQTASQFARYGYALNQVWKVTSLNLMRNFTYWKASDVWVDVRDVAGSAVGDAIGDILRRGVTVWRDPDKIGKVSVYDN